MDEQKITPMSFEDYLRQNGTLTYRFRGVSMLPMLRQRKHDLVTLVPKGAERCKKYDVAMYRHRKTPGTYVLHRIVRVGEDDYDFLGDNCVCRETGIRDEEIVGVLSAFHRSNRTISVTAPAYRLYSRVWVAIYPLRMLYKRLRRFAGRCYHYIVPRKAEKS